MTFEISYEEMKLVAEILLTARANGYTVNPLPFDPTPEQYRVLCRVLARMYDDMAVMERKIHGRNAKFSLLK